MNSTSRFLTLFVGLFCSFSAFAGGPEKAFSNEAARVLGLHENNFEAVLPCATPTTLVTHPTCSVAGSIMVTMSGGAGGTNYIYVLSGPMTGSSGGFVATTTWTFSGLAAGVYTVSVFSSDFTCPNPAANLTITLNAPPSLAMTASSTPTACIGSANGTITASASGGSGAINYSLSGPVNIAFQPSGSFTNLPAGSYTVTAKDANNCTATMAKSVGTTQPSAISVVLSSQTNATCFSGTGDATFSASGGFGGPYNYSLSGGAMNQTGFFSSLASAPTGFVHSVVVTDVAGCGFPQSTVSITSPSQISIGAASITAVSCNGAATGAIDLTVSGGPSGAYTYNWSGVGAGSDPRTGLAAGPYSVTVTSGGICTNTASFTVGTSSAITVVATTPVGVTHVSCHGGSNGSVNITAAGGTGLLTYDWAHIPGTTNIEDLPAVSAGTYSVTVKDAAGCTTAASFTVTHPLAALAAAPVVTNNACSGGATGAIALLANTSGGTAPYNFDWADVAGTNNPADRSSLIAGTYTVTITDAKGCTLVSATTITAPTTLTVSGVPMPGTLACFGYSNGQITATSTGGTGAISYELSASLFTTQTSPTGNFSGLPARTFSLKATDANLCTATTSVTIGQPANLTIALSSSTNSTCNGGSNGTATVTSTGGTGAKTYSISPSGGSNLTGSFTGLAAGSYTISVTDANACAGATVNVTITQPAPILVSLAQTSSVKCNGDADGSLTATVISGGVGPFSFELSNGNMSATGLFTGLAAGGYWVEVTATNGCTVEAPAFPALTYVTEPLALAVTTTQTNPTCNGATNGSITVTATGGITPYQYSKNNGATYQASNSFTGLAAGAYSIVVKDANGCTESPAVPVNIVAPAPLTALVTTVDVSCNGANDGQILVFPAGGTAPYDFSRSGGAFWTTPGNNGAGANTHVYTLPPGSYDVLVRDVNGCVSTSYLVDIFQPDPLSAAATVTHVTCNGASNGKIQMTPTGGTSPFSYQKAGPGGAMSSTTGLFENLAPGNYSITTTDARGCMFINSPVQVNEPVVLTVTATPTSPSCTNGSNGSITSSAAGGNGNYVYSLYQGAALVAPPNGTGAFSALPSGTYQVVVSDNKNCQAQASVVISNPTAVSAVGSQTGLPGAAGNLTIVLSGSNAPFTVTQVNGMTGVPVPMGYVYVGAGPAVFNNVPLGVYNFKTKNNNNCAGPDVVVNITPTFAALSAGMPTKTDATCFGSSNGTITVSPTGGAGGYQYSKDNGVTYQASNVFTGLAAATYQIVVKDAVNIQTAAIAVTVTSPTLIAIPVATITAPGCSGGATGSVTFGSSVSGGTSPYSYFWSNGTLASNLIGVAAGNYGYVVTDSKGCFSTASYTVPGAAGGAVTATATTTNVLCTGALTGLIDITPTGGTSPYTFLWSNMATTEDLTGVAAGTYTVTITATGGCTGTLSRTITQPAAALTATASATNINCVNATGSIALTVAGGTGLKTYDWADLPGASDPQNRTGLAVGTYNVTVTDANLCTATATAMISNTNNVSSVLTTTETGCTGLSDGTIQAVGFGGTSPYQFSLSGGAFTAAAGSHTFTGLSGGTYTVVTKDVAGCTHTGTATVGTAAIFTPSTTVTNVSCSGLSNGSIVATVAFPFNNPALYVYALNGGGFQASNTFTSLAAATYQVTVKRNTPTGCAVNIMATVMQPSVVTASISSTTPAGCNGSSTGSATAAGAGGQTGTAYTYLWPATAANQTTATATNLAAGTYIVTVTSTLGSCTATATATVGQPATPVSAIATVTPVNCNGQSNGSVLLTASGGTGAFMYSSNSGGVFGATSLFTGYAAGSIGAGVFQVKDANGCTFMLPTITITQPTVLAVATTPVPAACGTSNGSVSINGATATGGTPAYSYAWSKTATPATIIGTSTSISGLSADSYTVTATDSKGCTATSISTVTTSGAGAGSASIAQVLPVTCNGNGQILLALSGCVSSVEWFINTTATPISPAGVVTNPIMNLPAGTMYKYRVNGGALSSAITVATSTTSVLGIVIEDNTTTSVRLSWTPKPNVSGYQVRYKPCASMTWTNSGLLTATMFTATGLTANTCYNFEVRFETSGGCTGVWTATSPIQTTTVATYNPPIQIASNVNSNSSATVTWQQVAATAPTIVNVQIRYRALFPTGAYSTLTLAPGDLMSVLSALTPGRTYQYQVRNLYAAGNSAYSPNKQFTLPTLLSGSGPSGMIAADDAVFENAFDENFEGKTVENANDRSVKGSSAIEIAELIGLQIAPNPADEKVWIDLIRLVENRPVTVQVRSLEGRLVKTQRILAPNAHETLEMDVADLAAGIYFVEIHQDGQRKMAKLIRQ